MKKKRQKSDLLSVDENIVDWILEQNKYLDIQLDYDEIQTKIHFNFKTPVYQDNSKSPLKDQKGRICEVYCNIYITKCFGALYKTQISLIYNKCRIFGMDIQPYYESHNVDHPIYGNRCDFSGNHKQMHRNIKDKFHFRESENLKNLKTLTDIIMEFCNETNMNLLKKYIYNGGNRLQDFKLGVNHYEKTKPVRS